MRMYLEYLDGSVQLAKGDTIIGRHVTCSLRFNDPYLSRRHARIVFDGDSAFVEELSSRNGTLLNGVQVQGQVQLEHGDTLRVGERALNVVFLEGIADGDDETTRPAMHGPDEGWSAIEEAVRELEASGRGTLPSPPSERTCPNCRGRTDEALDTCVHCGYAFPKGRPAGTTQKFDLSAIEAELERSHERRVDPRRELVVPVVYASDTLTIDATTSDLSLSGVFVQSSLLDEVGTSCHVTLLPEASPAIPIPSSVARVVQRPDDPDACGMGIKFEELSDRATWWLHRVLGRNQGG